MNSGDTIRKLRKSQNIKQLDLANLIGVSRTHLSDVERGKKGISMKAAYKISKALGVPVSQLLSPQLNPNLPEIMRSSDNFNKNWESFYAAIKISKLSPAFEKLDKFGFYLSILKEDYDSFFSNLKNILFNEIDKGTNPKEVLKRNPEILEIISEYSKLIEYYKVGIPEGPHLESYKLIKTKMKIHLLKLGSKRIDDMN